MAGAAMGAKNGTIAPGRCNKAAKNNVSQVCRIPNTLRQKLGQSRFTGALAYSLQSAATKKQFLARVLLLFKQDLFIKLSPSLFKMPLHHVHAVLYQGEDNVYRIYITNHLC
ncbi:MAG TPA: hypothetical protein VIE65_07960 [Methylobacter sp.]